MKWTTVSALVVVAAIVLAGCGGGSGKEPAKAKAADTVTVDAKPADDAAPTDADAERWLAGWCKLSKGMSRAAAVKVMGKPTTEYSATEAAPQLNWEAGAYSFTAFTDTDGVVGQLQANYDTLGKSDRAKLSCPAVRH